MINLELCVIKRMRRLYPILLITPDASICDDCQSELWAEGNQRKNYPFITCTNCGPRYSIIQALPYDRPTTTMEAFSMCSSCLGEYTNPLDRRYYSQTNSCPKCAIQLSLYNAEANSKEAFNQVGILNFIPKLWQEGKIIAIKGIGGYILTCDAKNIETIQELRKRKYRATKPFALMFPDLTALSRVVEFWRSSYKSHPISSFANCPSSHQGKIY